MNLNDVELQALQRIEQAEQRSLWDRLTQACFRVWLDRCEKETSAAGSTVREHLQVFARLW